MIIKAISYNIFHCADYYDNETINYDAFAKVIKSLDADVIALNEVHGEGDDPEYDEQAKILGEKTGYNYYFAKATDIDGNNPFGNAVLTILPVKSFETIPIPDPEPQSYDGYYETRCVLKMVTDTQPQVTFFISHFGLNPDEQENAVKTVLENITDGYCVLMGDLNMRPDNKILAPIQKALNDTVSCADGEILSFPADKPDRKIDYIFTGEDIKVKSFRVLDIILSDHRPVEAVLEV